jgi:CBS domain-containing protein
MKIQDVMSKPVVTAPEAGTADMAARVMWEFDCGMVPIVRDDGRLVGVITDRDICMAAYTQGRPLSQIAVTSAMATHVVACQAGDAIETAERLMRDHLVRRIPVLDQESRPVGVVSLNDLARLAAHTKKRDIDRELVQTLAAVCRPRGIEQAEPSTNNIVAA